MRPHMDERVNVEDVPQPQTEGDERVPWRQAQVVIIGAAIRRSPAVRRKRNENAAEYPGAEPKGSVMQIGIGRGFAPRGVNTRPCVVGQRGSDEEPGLVAEEQADPAVGSAQRAGADQTTSPAVHSASRSAGR